MEWLERNVDLRLDPRRLLAGARSVLVVGMRYSPLLEEADRPSDDLWSTVARYARGSDYHDLLRRRLGEVARAIEKLLVDCRTRVCVDTAPILEREMAARAGLGAIGKNTHLLSPEHGSWFLLAEILMTAELAPDEPVADLCGECHSCLDACPTGALPEAYRLDSRRCLSYWTIEHRGAIDEEFRPHVADWTFGCDVCQEVCPWNRDLEPVSEPDLATPESRRELDLAGLLQLDEAGYRERFRGSAMKRAKRDGLRRNAALALAGSGDSSDVAALETASRDPSEVVRDAASWSLARIRRRNSPGD
jgi:epoxyqueuosine reductase